MGKGLGVRGQGAGAIPRIDRSGANDERASARVAAGVLWRAWVRALKARNGTARVILPFLLETAGVWVWLSVQRRGWR